MKKIVLTQERLRNSAETEAKLLCELRHENIVLYKECFTHGGHTLCVVMEYCSAADLAAEIQCARETPEEFYELQIVDWTFQICQALAVRVNHFVEIFRFIVIFKYIIHQPRIYIVGI